MTSTTASSSSSPLSTFPDGAVMIPDVSLAPLMAFFRLSSSESHSPSEFLTASEMELLSSTALGAPPRVLLHYRLFPILHSLGNNIGGHDALHGGVPCLAARSLPLMSVIPSALLSFSLYPSSSLLDHSSPNLPPTNPLISIEFVKLSTSDAASTAPLHLPPL